MAIKKISLENFTVFEKMNIDVCSGINVFIGENGTGKTHLLKALYAFVDWTKGNRFPETQDKREVMQFFKQLSECFSVTFGAIERNKKQFVISVVTDISNYTFSIDSQKGCEDVVRKENFSTAFIPAKEMLTHSGLEKDYIDRKLPLDITLIDILNKSGVSTLRNLSEDMGSILKKIENIIGGKVLYENNRYYIAKPNDVKIDFAVEAEGFKKLGLIYRLIETGNIAKDSVLIWDEPESNINPNNIPIIVDVLLELQRNGVQIFLATHSYDVARWFELNAEKDDELKYFNLKKTDNGVECSATSDKYKSLSDSVIEDASDKLYNAVMIKLNGEQKNV
jgi:AAA15 family ATPase/GTPase